MQGCEQYSLDAAESSAWCLLDFLFPSLSGAAETAHAACCSGCFSVPHIWTLYCRSLPTTFNIAFSLHPHTSSTVPPALSSCRITFVLPSTVLSHYGSSECQCQDDFLIQLFYPLLLCHFTFKIFHKLSIH